MTKIRFDFNNMMVNRIGAAHGIKEQEIENLRPKIEEVMNAYEKGNWGFRKLPYDTELVTRVNGLADRVIGKFDNLVIIGIGGSALGNRMLQKALNHPFYNMLSLKERAGRPRVFVLENVDPDTIDALFKVINCERTLFNIITKSGSTAETMSKFMIVKKMLTEKVGSSIYKEHIIVTTDPDNGVLREMARNEGFIALDIPPEVGGRFSVLSSVGLFSAAVTGIDVNELLHGARHMDEVTSRKDIWKNPACMSAVLQYLFYKKGRPMSVFMPYSDRLCDTSEWYAQLWAESLGKKYNNKSEVVSVGSTPIKAVGVIDQHSQLQLYMEGPEDKVIRFIKVEEFNEAIFMPKGFEEYPGISYLEGHSLNQLINAEQEGTELALTKNNHPNCTITLEKVAPFHLGALIFMLEAETAFMGHLLDIDPFNQPGVEASKQMTYALLGRKGYEEKKKEIQQIPERHKRYCLGC